VPGGGGTGGRGLLPAPHVAGEGAVAAGGRTASGGNMGGSGPSAPARGRSDQVICLRRTCASAFFGLSRKTCRRQSICSCGSDTARLRSIQPRSELGLFRTYRVSSGRAASGLPARSKSIAFWSSSVQSGSMRSPRGRAPRKATPGGISASQRSCPVTGSMPVSKEPSANWLTIAARSCRSRAESPPGVSGPGAIMSAPVAADSDCVPVSGVPAW
jgi:hypothetical protein